MVGGSRGDFDGHTNNVCRDAFIVKFWFGRLIGLWLSILFLQRMDCLVKPDNDGTVIIGLESDNPFVT